MIWPLFGLAVHGPGLSLVAITDEVALRLAALVGDGVHPPGDTPFSTDWASAPSPERERSALRHYWRHRVEWRPDDWTQQFAAVAGGEVVGSIDVAARDFRLMREVTTGSWLGLAHQGRGLGGLMRRAALHFAFVGLGAERAHSDAWEDNGASLAVSRRLGYRETHRRRARRGDRADTFVCFELDAEGFRRAHPADAYRIEGLDACRGFFGLG